MTNVQNSKVSLNIRLVADRMVVFLAREIKDYQTVFHGVASILPMIAIALARITNAPNLTYLNIPGGVNPTPSKMPSTTVGIQLMEGNKSFFSLSEIFDLSARGKLDLAFLSGAQIDSCGNINLSLIGESDKPKVKLPGGAGSAMILPTANRVVLWRTVHTKKTFPKTCSFITASGNVGNIITPLCIFKKTNGTLSLLSKHFGVDADSLTESTGFDIGNINDFPETVEPSREELDALHKVDPLGIRYKEFV
ncbi:MAG: CoA-transferase [Nitrospinota bacterium]|nr:CoA-transferase [Nitrospinota bacterium]